jgi:hypothetical protein
VFADWTLAVRLLPLVDLTMARHSLIISLCITIFCLLAGREAKASSTVTLAWDAEASASGFVVSLGTQSGVYTTHIDVGNVTSEAVPNLADNTTYYFVVQAYDSQGNTSAPSTEVVGQTAPGTPPPTPSPTPLSIMCPIPTGSSSNGGPVGVSFSDPTTSGGTAPVTTSCSPSSGSSFGVGTTSLTCTATDAASATAVCTSSVIVTGPAAPTPVSIPTPTPVSPPTPIPLPQSSPAVVSNTNSSGGSSSPASSGPPTYQMAPPPGAFGFSSHGYYRPDGGWQETPLVGGSTTPASNGAAPASRGSWSGTPTYGVPPPPGAFGFSSHGYYRPDGGWQETSMIGGGVPAPTQVASGGPTPSYQMAPPPGSFGFNSHGYYRPDGGWQETPMMGTASVSQRATAAAAGAPLSSASSATPVAVTVSNAQGYYRPDGGWQQVAPLTAPSASSNGSSPSATGTGSSVFRAAPSMSGQAVTSPAPIGPSPAAPAQGPAATSIGVLATTVSLASAAATPTLTNASPGTGTILVVSAPTSVAPAPWASNDPSPADGATGLSPSVTATWTADGNAVSFDVYFGKVSNPPLLTQGLTRPTIAFRSLAGNTTYYWRVVAKNANGETTSETWSFKTGAPQ